MMMGSEITMGLRLKVPDEPAVKTVNIAKGKTLQRVSDAAELPIEADATQTGYAAVVVNEDGTAHQVGWIVNHSRFGVAEAWFVDAKDVT